MRAVGTDSLRELAIVALLLGLVEVPIACAQGSVLRSAGAGAGTASSTSTVVGSVTVGGGGGAGNAGGSGPSSPCDGTGDCSLCAECANCLVCASQADDCANNADCTNIVTCAGNCAEGDSACVESCLSAYPAGDQLFNAYNDCLACACVSDCQVPAGECP
jgi:hypothetical protein